MSSLAHRTAAELTWLRSRGSRKNVAGMARFGIVATKIFGISVADLRARARIIGRDHALAQKLWATGWYEARLLAAFVDDPAKVTVGQMNRWMRSFENWADCDTTCFHLFDKTPYAWGRIRAWSTRRREIEKRAAFALIASVAAHDRAAPDAPFARALTLIVREAHDPRNYVKKGVSWALRCIGHRSPALHAKAMAVARRLADSHNAAERWVGKDAIRDLSRKMKFRAKPLN